jgi:hypothetical protein
MKAYKKRNDSTREYNLRGLRFLVPSTPGWTVSQAVSN